MFDPFFRRHHQAMGDPAEDCDSGQWRVLLPGGPWEGGAEPWPDPYDGQGVQGQAPSHAGTATQPCNHSNTITYQFQVEFIDQICLPVYKNLIVMSDHLQPMLTGKTIAGKIGGIISILGTVNKIQICLGLFSVFSMFKKWFHILTKKIKKWNLNVWPLKSRVTSVIVCPGCQKNRENWSSLIGVKTADRSQEPETEETEEEKIVSWVFVSLGLLFFNL